MKHIKTFKKGNLINQDNFDGSTNYNSLELIENNDQVLKDNLNRPLTNIQDSLNNISFINSRISASLGFKDGIYLSDFSFNPNTDIKTVKVKDSSDNIIRKHFLRINPGVAFIKANNIAHLPTVSIAERQLYKILNLKSNDEKVNIFYYPNSDKYQIQIQKNDSSGNLQDYNYTKFGDFGDSLVGFDTGIEALLNVYGDSDNFTDFKDTIYENIENINLEENIILTGGDSIFVGLNDNGYLIGDTYGTYFDLYHITTELNNDNIRLVTCIDLRKSIEGDYKNNELIDEGNFLNNILPSLENEGIVFINQNGTFNISNRENFGSKIGDTLSGNFVTTGNSTLYFSEDNEIDNPHNLNSGNLYRFSVRIKLSRETTVTKLFSINSNNNALYTVNASDGTASRVHATNALGTGNWSSLASHNETLYAIDDTNNALYTVNANTGIATRVHATNTFGTGDWSSLASLNGTLYTVNDTNNALYTVDASDGTATRVHATNTLGNGIWESLASHNGTLYAINDDYSTNALYTVNATDGTATRVHASNNFGIGIWESLASHSGTLYTVNDTNNALYTVNATDGTATRVHATRTLPSLGFWRSLVSHTSMLEESDIDENVTPHNNISFNLYEYSDLLPVVTSIIARNTTEWQELIINKRLNENITGVTFGININSAGNIFVDDVSAKSIGRSGGPRFINIRNITGDTLLINYIDSIGDSQVTFENRISGDTLFFDTMLADIFINKLDGDTLSLDTLSTDYLKSKTGDTINLLDKLLGDSACLDTLQVENFRGPGSYKKPSERRDIFVESSSSLSVFIASEARVFRINSGGGNRTITLPTLTNEDVGFSVYIIKRSSSNNLTITPGNGNISGDNNRVLKENNEAVYLKWNGNNWFVLSIAIKGDLLAEEQGDSKYSFDGHIHNYLTNIPNKYLTLSEGDSKYSFEDHGHGAQFTGNYLTEPEGDSKYDTRSQVNSKINNNLTDTISGGAPSNLNTLNEIAEAIDDNPNYHSAVTTGLNSKITQTAADNRYPLKNHNHNEYLTQPEGDSKYDTKAQVTSKVNSNFINTIRDGAPSNLNT